MEALLREVLRHGIVKGRLGVTFASGRQRWFGRDRGPEVAIRLQDPNAELSLALDPALRLGELYADGRLVLTAGSVYDLVATFKRNSRNAGMLPAAAAQLLRSAKLTRHRTNAVERAKHNVEAHYDRDPAFYQLFLDPDMQYSCAYFEHAEQSLAAAQLAKKRHIASKLLVSPGQRVLDIGCGWGGMALYLSSVTQAQVTGVTLSEPQRAHAEARARALGLADQARFALTDYRELDARFDRIVSVGMFEHVGRPHYRAFFRRCAHLLDPRGVMVLHSIGRTRPRPSPSPFIDKHIFPGSYIPALSEVLPAVERAGFLVTDIEILPLHYARTLRAWRERFVAQRPEVVARYGERAFRLWEFYLAASESGFRIDRMFVFQLQLTRPQNVVPIERSYIAERERELRRREAELPAYAAVEPRAIRDERSAPDDLLP